LRNRWLAVESGAVLVRRENPSDASRIRSVVAAAFAASDERAATVPEARLVDQLRASPSWLPALSLVALSPDGEIIGHVLGTRGHLGTVPAVALAPVSVRPQDQRQGVGSALMHAVIGAADASGEPLIALLGEAAYYSRFGFRPGTDHGIAPPVASWGEHFQVRVLDAYHPGVVGVFRYPAAFDAL
jgi:putative acetyltransferase